MAVYSNLPTFTYIKWDNMMIAYNGQVYPIQNSYTNNEYVYFDTSNPYQLLCSNEKKTEIGGRFLVIINEKGIHTLVPHEDLVVTFDGDNSDLIAEKIFGIYETNKEFGDKFVSVETDIEGVKTTVGKVERENNEIKESVSLIDQKADKISQEVKKIEKTFNESQDTIDLRERLNKSIIDINAGLGIFKSYFGEIKTGSLDTVTKTEINTHIDVLIKNKEAMILQVNKVEVLMEQGGFTDKLNNLTSSKTAAINAIDNLVTIIRTSISDNIYVPSEVTIIVDAFGKAATKINILKNSCDDCIFLGTGGSVVEELSRLDMKSNEIVLSVSKTEESLKNTLSVNKAQAQGQIQDLQTAISNFRQALKTIFEDGKVSEIEKGVISEHYVKLDKEKSDIDSLYNTYVSDVNLSESQKNSLKTAYNDFVASHNNVKSKINEVIQDGFINESEMAQVDSELLKYENQSNQLLRGICHALDDIETNRNNKAVADAKKQLQQEIGEVNSKVGDLDNTINTTFKDNVIDEAERNSIKQNLNILKSEKADVDKQYEQLYKNTHLAGQLKIDFKAAYDSFVSKYNSLVSIIEGILNKPTLIEDNDRRNMDNAYELMNTSLADFTTVANQVIENVAKKEAEAVKSQLDKDIEEVNNKIDGLDLSIDGTFVNNILDQAERKDIEDNLNILKREKIDVDNQYNQLILSPYLDGQLKVDYTNKYDEFTTKFTALEKVITDILEKVDLINDTDRLNMNSAHESLNIVIGELVTLSNKVIEYIGKRQSESSMEDLNGQLGDLNNKVDNIVENVTEAVSDSVLDKSERQTLKESLNVLNSQKSQIDSQYTLVYSNANLTDSPIKNELKTAYDSFNQKYSLLINSIENLLDKVENITEIDRNNYASSYNEYKTAISNYTAKLQLANEEIFNKGIKDAKQELNNEILDVSESLSNLSNTMEGVFKDGILSESEKIAIRQNLKTLETEKSDIDKTYSTLYSNDKLIGSAKVNLKSSYDIYIEKYNGLISVINGILEKTGLVDSTDQKNLNTAFDAHKVALGNFREKYSLALDSVTTKSVEDVKQSLVQDIGEVSGAVNDLQNTMNGVFKDGILSDSEKLAIKQNLQSLLIEKADIDKQYSVIYSNADLLGDAKTNLKTAYDDYISKYNSLVNTINTIINKSGIVDSADNDSLNAAFTSHSVALGTYSMRINEAIDSIAKKKSDDAYNNSKTYTNSEITVLSDSINSKVSKIEEKQSEMDGNLNTLNIWKTEAEQKITDEAITNTVKKNFYTKEETENSITSKGYQTQSEVQQTANEVQFRFEESGGYNKIKNSAFRNGTSYWTYLSWNNFAGNAVATGNFGIIEPGDKWCLQNRNVLQAYAWGLNASLDNGGVLGVGFDSAGMWGGVDWTFSCLLASHRANSVIIEIIELDANGNRMPEVNSWSVIAKTGGADRNNWTRVCEKFTLKNQGCAQFFVRIFLGSWNREEDSAYLFMAEPQVVLGHKDVPYTLSSDEFYSGIVRSDMNGVIVSMADGEGSQGYSRMAHDGFSIFDSNGSRKAWFGDSDSAYIQQLSADDIFCNKVVKYATERPTNFYVSTTATGDGTGRNISNKSNSLNHTLDYIKNTYGQVSCRQDIVIYVDDGVYNESVYIGGWMGTGLLYVNFGKAVVWYGNFVIEENQMVILLQGQKTNIDINDGATLETRNNQPTVYVRNSTCRVSAFKARCESGYYSGSFLKADLGATAMVYYNDLVGFSAVAQAHNMSTVYAVDNIGDVDVVAGWGGTGTVILSGYCPFLKNNHLTWGNYATHEVDLGCTQKNSVWIPRVDATPTPPPTPSVTWQTFSKSFTVTNLRSVPEGTGSVTSGIASCMAQGYWGSYKAHRGYGDLGDSPASWCSGGRNFSITCTMRRKNSSHGNNSATPHPIFIHTDGSSWDSGTYYGRGEAKTFTFPSSIASAIASGSMKTLQIWAGRSTAQYSHYDAVSITITCEKQV